MKYQIYSLGYEKRTIEEYVSYLKKNDINVLIDIRKTAWSYKRNFCKKNFSDYLANYNIEYVHLPNAGNPKSIRQSSNSPIKVLKKYKTYLLDSRNGIDESLFLISYLFQENKNVCFTCYERDHKFCHREVFMSELANHFDNLSISHL